MKLNKKLSTILIAILIVGMSSTFIGFKSDEDYFEISKNLDIFATLFKELNLYYVDETEPTELMRKGIDEMLKSLDPYTTYIPESKIESYKLMTTGQYGGIGSLIKYLDDYVVIAEPYEGFPAFKAGLKAGDKIIEINGNTTKGKNTKDISELLKGQPNTSVKVKIERPGTEELLEITIVREEIKLKSVPYYGMLNDEIGYIRLTSFTHKAHKFLREGLIELKQKQNAQAIVLDLRGNPGGLLNEAVSIVNLFIEKGQEVVSTKAKIKEWDKSYKTTNQPFDKEMPLVVLVNRGSASASEIVSGAIQDLDRGVVIGKRTFGKGLVQATRNLSYNSKLKLTTAKYYIPSGRCIQALDYTHRNDDGSVGKVPDSLITEFATKNNRKVYDGGGVLPDIEVESQTLSKIAISLLLKSIIFNYATEYCIKHDSIAPLKEYAFTDEEYDVFVNYLADKDYDYETKCEAKLKELKEEAEKEKYYDLASEEFDALHTKLAHDKDKDLTVFKEEIKDLLQQEIIGRYYYQKGRIEATLINDEAALKAIEILSNPQDYQAILNGTYEDGNIKD